MTYFWISIILLFYYLSIQYSVYLIFKFKKIPVAQFFIPFYSTHLLIKNIQKPWWWTICYYLPFLGFIIWMNIITEFIKRMGKNQFYELLLALVLPPIYFKLILTPENKWRNNAEIASIKKNTLKEWFDSITFALIAATIIRWFYIEAFMIPTSSMEKTMLVGDFLFVSKISYGIRVPNTPIAFPLAHHTLPFTQKTQSYSNWPNLPYKRLFEWNTVQRNDIVVFNFPAGDTVVIEHQDQTYYQLARDYGRELLHQQFNITARPVDKRENYIKRCVAIAGDTLEIKNTILYINGKEAIQPENLQYLYEVKSNYNISKKIIKENNISEIYETEKSNEYLIMLNEKNKRALEIWDKNIQIKRKNKPTNTGSSGQKLAIFPNHPFYNWTEDNFGPLWIPEKGKTIDLNLNNLPFYERIITAYEKNKLNIVNNQIYINDKIANTYTFSMNYYWLMGDNRHNSLDSRYWGFVPEDHVVGKPVLVWLSLDEKENNWLSKIRFNRFFHIPK